MSNRRNSLRFALILVAILTEVESDTRLSARTSDVSRTGCYVDINPVPQGNSSASCQAVVRNPRKAAGALCTSVRASAWAFDLKNRLSHINRKL